MKRLEPIVVQAPQRSDQWYQSRLGNVTASGVKKTMGYYKPTAAQIAQATEVYQANEVDPLFIEELLLISPAEYCVGVGIELQETAERTTYRQDLVTERITKMRSDTDQYVTEDMKWGIANEWSAKELYVEVTGNILKDAPLMLHPNMLLGASPDGLVIDIETGELGNAEIKCLKSRNHLYKIIRDDEMPDEFYDQVQCQMLITGRDWCDFIAYDSRVKEDLKLFIKRILYDDFYVDNVMGPMIERFLKECDRDERQFYAIAKARRERAIAQLEYAR